MEVNNERAPLRPFKELEGGQVFEHCGVYLLKIERCLGISTHDHINAVSFTDGGHHFIGESILVAPIRAKLNIVG